jgi:DNA-binding NtrC family response regulator
MTSPPSDSDSTGQLDNASPQRVKVLIADDDAVTLRVLHRYLSTAGYECITATDGREALARMSAEISLALFDLEMPHASGLDCLEKVKATHPDTVVVVVSGKGQISDAVSAMKKGAADYITKPFDRDELIARVNQAAWAANLARENRGLRAAVADAGPSSDFVAQAPVTQLLVRQVAKVAPLDSTVMITGESGTGKTTVARLIHQMGPRKAGPFVTVNCASLPRDLVEAELFGHAKGAFTGAVSDRPGRAEIADRGTLFLDEIGDLPLELQPKLLTFLQDRTFQRIGSNKVYKVDVRVIAATHQNLAGMCREKRFREDLFFRLNVLSLHMPALRERPQDVEGLVRHVLRRIADRRGLPSLVCDSQAIAALCQHRWPGNVRELENVLERASAFCESSVIRIEDLWFPSLGNADSPAASPLPFTQSALISEKPATRVADAGDAVTTMPADDADAMPAATVACLSPPRLPRERDEEFMASSPLSGTAPATLTPAASAPATSLAGMTLDELERQAILDTLNACGGNKAETARRLGISEKSIYNKLKRFSLPTG